MDRELLRLHDAGVEPWRGRSVLVTGHTGFKGAWLSLWLQACGAQVTGLALAPPTTPDLFTAACVADGMTSVIGDIRDLAVVQDVIDRARPEVVFHLAAQSLVRAGYADPLDTFATNVVGTATVLEAVRRARLPTVRAVVCVTSDKCYENHEWPWGYRETDPMGGHDPYSASKGCAELVVASFRRSMFTTSDAALIATVRAGNVIGGGDWSTDRLLPDVARAFIAGQPAVVRRPGAVRPWQHVVEPLGAYLLVAERLLAGDTVVADGWNIGPRADEAWPVRDVVAAAARHWGDGATWCSEPDAGPHEAGQLRLDCSKASTLLGWRPRLAIDDAIAWTVDWYRSWAEGGDARALTLGQLAAYEALAATRPNSRVCSP